MSAREANSISMLGLAHVGDAVYFDTIESKFQQGVAADLITDDEVKAAVAEYLKNRKA